MGGPKRAVDGVVCESVITWKWGVGAQPARWECAREVPSRGGLVEGGLVKEKKKRRRERERSGEK